MSSYQICDLCEQAVESVWHLRLELHWSDATWTETNITEQHLCWDCLRSLDSMRLSAGETELVFTKKVKEDAAHGE